MPSTLPESVEAARVGGTVIDRAREGTSARESWVMFVLLWAAYVLLRSPLYIGDALRWLPSTTADAFPTEGGGARHYFFRWYGWLVFHAGDALGLAGGAPGTNTGAIALVQGMNALLSAATVVVVFRWLRRLVTRPAAYAGAAFVACSSGFMMHTTNATEPASALLPALLGLSLIARAPERRSVRVLSGLLVGAATSLYLIAAVIVVPAGCYAALRGVRSREPVLVKRLWAAAEHAVPAGLCYAGLIVVSELFAHPERGLVAALHHPFDFGLHGLYGKFRIVSVVGALFGFATSLYPFPPSEGMLRLLHLPLASILTILTVCLLTFAFLGMLGLGLYRARQRLLADGRWVDAAAAVGLFVAVYGVALYFLPGYDKFWLFASFAIAVLVALVVDSTLAESGSIGSGRSPRAIARALLVVAPGVALLAGNVVLGVIPRRLTVNPDLVAAQALATYLGPKDLLVCRGWDGPSVSARYLLKPALECFSLVDHVLDARMDHARVLQELDARVRATRENGGKVYFLNLLELSPDGWRTFFGNELGLPYGIFDAYRPRAVPVELAGIVRPYCQLSEVAPP